MYILSTSVYCVVYVRVVWITIYNPMEFIMFSMYLLKKCYCDVYENKLRMYFNASCVLLILLVSVGYSSLLTLYVLYYKPGSPGTWSTPLQKEDYCSESLGRACVVFALVPSFQWLEVLVCLHMLEQCIAPSPPLQNMPL